MLQILPRFPCKTLPPKQIARPQTLGRCFKNQLKHTGWQLAPSYRKPKLLEFAGKFPYMDHHGYGETSRWIGWNHASPAKGWWLFRDLHWKKPYQISRGKVWVQGTVPKICQVVRPNFSQVSHEKKPSDPFHYTGWLIGILISWFITIPI